MITSTSNAKVKWLLQLQKKRKAREAEAVFIIEGLRMFEETPVDRISEVYVSKCFYEKYQAKLKELKVEILSENVFEYVSDTKSPQGILCVVKMKSSTVTQLLEKEPAHILILEDIQDPGNLGTILRSAEGAGVTGVILSANCVDIYNPKTIRSTMGSIYRVPFLYVADMAEMIQRIKQVKIRVYAADLRGNEYCGEERYQGGVAFLLGNEGNGLSSQIEAFADEKVMIPMEGQVESLNVAIAAAILMFEVRRQRR